ncbi:MAG: DUF1707 domain-containing protein [Gemmatimonadota bacterium]
MSDQPNVPASRPPTAERRDITIEALSSLFAAGRLELEEFEARVDRAIRAETVAALDALVADLAPTGEHRTAPAPPREPMGQDLPRRSRATIAVLSGTQRNGRWFPAPRHVGIALMGGFELDFREAELGPGTTDVYLYTLFGGIGVIVPPDLDVEVGGMAVMGGLTHLASHPARLESQRPRLRIHAYALMGAVDVQVRLPGETAKEARQRLRREQRRLRAGDEE